MTWSGCLMFLFYVFHYHKPFVLRASKSCIMQNNLTLFSMNSPKMRKAHYVPLSFTSCVCEDTKFWKLSLCHVLECNLTHR